jgi:hypothetical protein
VEALSTFDAFNLYVPYSQWIFRDSDRRAIGCGTAQNAARTDSEVHPKECTRASGFAEHDDGPAPDWE